MRQYYFIAIVIIVLLGCKAKQPVVDTYADDEPAMDTVQESRSPEILFEEGPIYRASRTRLMDLIHTRLEISLDWEQQRLDGLATLQLQPYFKPQDMVVLDAKNFDIHYIKLIDGTEKEDLDYFYDNLRLWIELDTVYAREQDVFLEISYTAKPAERELGGSEAILSDQGLYFINPEGTHPTKPRQVWTQGETEANSCWFPTIDSPNERTTQEIFITVKENFTTLSNGELIYSKFNADSTRTDYWKMDLPHAPYLFMIAVGEFEVIEDQWEDIPLYYYMEKEYAPYARDIFGSTPEMMRFFSETYGMDYIWPKYAQVVVRDYVSGAMENTTASVFYEQLNVDRRELIDYHFDKIIAHELAHHWFGDLVTCESWANITLNEGFANYAEYLWYEHKYGPYEADLHNLEELSDYIEESRTKQVDLIRFHYADKEDVFDSHSYAKGGLVLHMLREYLGDDVFFTALNQYLQEHQFSSVEVHDLRLSFEEVSGEDLNWFFHQWYLSSGHPILEVTENYTDSTVQLTVTQLQDPLTTPLYTLPLTVDLYDEEGMESYYIVLDQWEQTFEFPVNDKPNLVVFDGAQKLLAEVTHQKTLDAYHYQFEFTDKFLPRYVALDTLLKSGDDSLKILVMQSALQDDFWYFRQMAVNAVESLDEEDQQLFVESMATMADQDPKSQVRADALLVLQAISGDRYVDLFRKSIDDSSYMVSGSAMYIFSELRPDEFGEIAPAYEEADNLNVVIPLASFYIDAGIPDKYSWFILKMEKMSPDGLWYMLQYFGEYMMNEPELMQRRSIAVLENYARYHNKVYIRLAAYQALGLLSDLSGVENLREDIRVNESDEYLRELYQSLL